MGFDILYTQFDSVFSKRPGFNDDNSLPGEREFRLRESRPWSAGPTARIYASSEKLQDAGYIEPAKEIIRFQGPDFYSLTKEGKSFSEIYFFYGIRSGSTRP